MPLRLSIENLTSLPDGGPVSFEVAGKRGLDIGRDQYLDWVLPDPNRVVSGKHCEVRYQDGSYWLRDVSTNGTFVNQNPRRISEPHRLRHGDRVEVGHYIIRVELSGEEAQAEGVTPDSGGTWDVDTAAPPVDPGSFKAPPKPHLLAADPLDHWLSPPPPVPAPPPPPSSATPPADIWGDSDFYARPDPSVAPRRRLPLPPEYEPSSQGGTNVAPGGTNVAPMPQAPPVPPPVSVAPVPPPPPAPAYPPPPGPTPYGAPPQPQPPPYEMPPPVPSYGAPPQAPPYEAQPQVPAYPAHPQAPPYAPPPSSGYAPHPGYPPPPGYPPQQASPYAPPPAAPPYPGAPYPPAPPPPVAAAPPPSPPTITPGPRSRGDANAGAEFIRRFAEGAGIEPEIVHPRDAGDLAEMLGMLMQVCAGNVAQLLAARAQSKNAMRSSNQTLIQLQGNNPLRWAPSPQDALKLMFGRPTPSYVDACNAFEKSFETLKNHQIDTFASLQEAIQVLLADLDPAVIERAAGVDGKKGGLFGSDRAQKAKLWDEYTARWKSKTGSHDSGLFAAFMRVFGEAYDRKGD